MFRRCVHMGALMGGTKRKKVQNVEKYEFYSVKKSLLVNLAPLARPCHQFHGEIANTVQKHISSHNPLDISSRNGQR